MAASAILAIKILADASGAQKGMNQAGASTSKFASGLGKASAAAAVGLAAVGAVMVSGVRAAAEDAQAQTVLAQALKNTTGATDSQVAATEKFITKTALASGVADDELRPALGNLVRGTKDVSKAQDAMGLALDISAATGKDLGTVTAAMAKGYGGNTAALGKLVPGLDKATLATKDMNKITDELQKTVGGTSAAAADTAAGKYKRMQVAIDETKESLGAALLPALEKVVPLLLKMATWASENSTTLLVIAGALAAVATAVYVVNTALKVYKATMLVIQAVQMATFLTNPIFLVVLAVVALVAAVVLLWKKSETFRSIVLGVWAAIKVAISAVVEFFKAAWNVAFAIVKGYFTVYKTVVLAIFTAIKTAVTTVTSFFKTAWNTAVTLVKGYFTAWKTVVTTIFGAIRTAISAITSFFSSAWNTAVSTVKTIFGGLTAVVTAPFKAIQSAIETAIGWIDKLIKKISGIHMPSFSFPDLNPFSASAAPAPALSRGARTGAATTSTGGGNIHITVNGAIDPEGVARTLQRVLGGHNRRVGTAAAI